jgi:hypothetical protein
MVRLTLIISLLQINFAVAQNKQPTNKNSYKGFAVAELFTSQGCNTCPAADKVLGEVIADAKKNNKPVFALSFHVDYWNRLGWKDPFSKFAFSKRQNNYASALGEKTVYTPQIFINGKTALTGSDKNKISTQIEKEINTPAPVNLNIFNSAMSTADTLVLNYTSSKADKNFSLVVVIVQKTATTKIGKGENGGKTLVNENIVRVFEIFSLGTAKGTVKVPVNNLLLNKSVSLIAYVQQKQSKKILGAMGFDF